MPRVHRGRGGEGERGRERGRERREENGQGNGPIGVEKHDGYMLRTYYLDT